MVVQRLKSNHSELLIDGSCAGILFRILINSWSILDSKSSPLDIVLHQLT